MPGQKLRVVYLAGSGHTGSTLVALLLDAHPAIASVGEAAVKSKIRRRGAQLEQKCSCGALVAECLFWRAIFRRVTEQGIEFGAANWTNDYRCEAALADRLLTLDSSYRPVRALQLWAARSLPFYRARVRRIHRVNVAFIRAVLEQTRAQVFVDTSKLPMRLSHLLGIPELDVRVVTLVRDVRGFAASAKRRGKPVSAAAQAWKRDQVLIADVTRDLPADRSLLVRYEDLCRRPAETLRTLWDFCGVDPIDPPAAVLSRDHHVLGNSMRLAGTIQIQLDERWRDSLGENEQAQVLRIAGGLNQRFGYV
jgi:hypothetical protein